uniref:Amiloride-sensitive sodium channel n=1 Tax=Steinernema glaseri TaxID=37863 RepID=A0A1I8A989_9BILA
MSTSSNGIYHISNGDTYRRSKLVFFMNIYSVDSFSQYSIRPTFQRSDAKNYQADEKCACHVRWAYELHGLTQFLKSTTVLGRIFWGTLLVVCICGAFLNFYAVFSEYLKRQTATLFTIKQERQLLFPSITFCPKNVDALNFRNIREDISSSLGNVSRALSDRLIALILTGSGFKDMDGNLNNIQHTDKSLHDAYNIWRGNRSDTMIYELFYDKNGYDCEQLLQTCYYGSQKFNCCDKFYPVYVMLRGRCFKMAPKYQADEDEEGKLSFTIHSMDSPFGGKAGKQPQVVVYISNPKDEIALYDRYYLGLNEWNRMRFRLRETRMLPGREGCVQRENGVGRATCFVEKWHRKVVQRFNCSLFYMQSKAPGYPVCDPFTIAENYDVLVNFSVQALACLPSCNRYDHTVEVFSSELATTRESDYKVFHLEASYTDLQV